MSKNDILKRINRALNPDGTSVDFKLFDAEVAKLKASLKEKVQMQTIDDVKGELEKFKKRIDFNPLIQALSQTEQGINEQIKNLSTQLDGKIAEFKVSVSGKDKVSQEKLVGLTNEITSLKGQISKLDDEKNGEIKKIKNNLTELITFGDRLDRMVRTINKDVAEFKTGSAKESDSTNKKLDAIKIALEETDTQLRERINNIANRGGGSMNRKITIGGVDYLTRYTDLNLIAGTNMTLTAANDDTNKRVNITFAAAGGSLNFETPTGAVDDSNTSFTVSNTPKLLNINGAVYTEGVGIYTSYVAGTITLSSPVGVGGFIISIY